MSANTDPSSEARLRPREEALLGALTELMSRWTSAELQALFAAQHGAGQLGAVRESAAQRDVAHNSVAHNSAAREGAAREGAAQGRATRNTPVLDDAMVRAIYVLGLRGGAARPSTLAAELRMTRPTTSKLLARLRADGLLDRRDDPTDGRATQVELTPLGTGVFTRLVDAGHDMVLRALGGWSERDVEQLTGLLSRFVDGLMVEATGLTAAGAAASQDFAPAPAGAPAHGATSGRRIPQVK